MGAVVYFHQWLNRELDFAIFYLSQSHSTWTILHQISSTESKIDLFSQLARLLFRDKRSVARIKSLVRELKKVNGHRNDIIHGRFLGVGRLGAQLQRMKPRSEELDHKLLNLTPHQIHVIARRMFVLIKRLRKFDIAIGKANAAKAKQQASRKK
jgi:hypothetical protein